MSDGETYDVMAPLTHPDVPAYLHRRVGVRVADHVPSHPGLGGQPAYQVEAESISVNTAAMGGFVPAGEVEAAITARLRWVIERLDATLAEAWRHRERLATAYLKRTGQYPASEASLPILKMLRDELELRDALVAALRPFISPLQREFLAECADENRVALVATAALPTLKSYEVSTDLGTLRRLWVAFDALAGIEETAL